MMPALHAILACAALLPATSAAPVSTMVKLNDGRRMPRLNLGTCCGSDPKIGLKPWLKDARPVMGANSPIGIDTAWDYHDETTIGQILQDTKTPRETVFITSKIPTGFGNETDCAADPSMVVRYMKDNLAQLGVSYVDLALLHHPCPGRTGAAGDEPTIDGALWKGLLQAQKAGMVKSVGVSNYDATQLAAVDWNGTVPSVNQCHMSVGQHDDATIAYCQQHGIIYEAYGGMRTCYGQTFTPALQTIADAHKTGVAQVCLRWVLQRGAIMAIGTGEDSQKIDQYTKEDLDLFNFTLTDADMTNINKMTK